MNRTLLIIALAPGFAAAQAEPPGPVPGRFDSLSAGSGPAPVRGQDASVGDAGEDRITSPAVGLVFSGVFGPGNISARAAYYVKPISAGWGVRVLVARWGDSPGVVCPQSFPLSYACDAEGWYLRSGAGWSSPPAGNLTLFGELSGGVNLRFGPGDRRTFSALLGGAIGGLFEITDRIFARVEATRVEVFDSPYEQLMDASLRFRSVDLALEYRLTPADPGPSEH